LQYDKEGFTTALQIDQQWRLRVSDLFQFFQISNPVSIGTNDYVAWT
jgi:hypothetical protein